MTATFDAIATGTDIQRRIGVKTSRDEPLARFTTMRVGGPADLFASVHNAFELKAIVRFARSRGLPHVVLGRGSDVIISDAGIRGLVIQDRAEGSKVVGSTYIADAGVPMARAATETQKAGLSGLEFGLAIPGSVGRRGLGQCRRARIGDGGGPAIRPGAPRRWDRGGRAGRAISGLAYRDSRFKHGDPDGPTELIVEATFELEPADADTIKTPSR